jgi:hypothetical protein
MNRIRNPTRTLAQAAGAWLQYEYACGRSMLFNERYLSVPISSALHAIYKQEVHSEFLHPVLAPEKTGPGRRPEVDFAVIGDSSNPSCVLESKWVGGNSLAAEEVVWDLLRLELVAHFSQAAAFFLLGGKRRHLEHFFQSRAFLGAPTKDGKYRRLLKLDERRNPRIRVDAPAHDRIELFQKLLRPYQNISFSSRVTTSTGHRYPEDTPMFQYQVYAWRVLAPPSVHRFFPRNHGLYKSPQITPL